MPAPGCCQVAAVVGVDARGQMVLPKETRDRLGLAPDAKLAVVEWSHEGKTDCLTLVRVDELADAVRRAYGPMLKEIIRG